MRSFATYLVISVLFCSPLFAAEKSTLTGWFSDQSCATNRARNGTYTPTNPDCALDCIRKGVKMVLISERDKKIYVIANPELGQDHFAEHVSVIGTVDTSDVLHIDSVKDLGDYVGPACTRPKKK